MTPTRPRWLLTILLAAGAIGSASAQEHCVRSPGEHYDEGVAFQLGQKGVAHTLTAARGVCVADRLAGEVEAAMKRLDQFFWKVDRMVVDRCEERALVEWAQAEKLRFDVSTVVDLGGNPAGRVFRLRSYTQEEVLANRRKLEQAPKDVSCRPATVA